MTALISEALQAGLDVRAGLHCVFGCVYEGQISADAVLRATEKMAATGVKEINLADTTGMATPLAIRDIVGRVQGHFPDLAISLHLHDTRGWGWPTCLPALRPVFAFSTPARPVLAAVLSSRGPPATCPPRMP